MIHLRWLALLSLLTVQGFCADAAVLLDKANALPLALDDAFEFRKIKTEVLDPDQQKQSVDRMLNFQRPHRYFGAVSGVERRARQGQYFTFFWRTKRETALTVRFEYRQANLGSYVMAKEYFYDNAKGSVRTEFSVLGDDYVDDGRVTQWRALLIEEGKIVGLTQSFLWN